MFLYKAVLKAIIVFFWYAIGLNTYECILNVSLLTTIYTEPVGKGVKSTDEMKLRIPRITR